MLCTGKPLYRVPILLKPIAYSFKSVQNTNCGVQSCGTCAVHASKMWFGFVVVQFSELFLKGTFFLFQKRGENHKYRTFQKVKLEPVQFF